MTEDQLESWHLESTRQEARERLNRLTELAAVRDPESYKRLVNELDMRANPPDPEGDGDFGKDDIRMLRKIFGNRDELPGHEELRFARRHPK